VTRRLVFISGGITHASFGGIGLGVFFGINPILSGAIVCHTVRLAESSGSVSGEMYGQIVP